MASDNNITKEKPVVIEPYEKNGFTKVVVYSEGVKLDWVTKELPPLKEIEVAGKKYTDDRERMAFIENLAEKVADRIK